MKTVEARVAKLERDRGIKFLAGCPECGWHGKPRWEIIGGLRGLDIQRFGGCFMCKAVSVLRRIDWRSPEERDATPDPWS